MAITGYNTAPTNDNSQQMVQFGTNYTIAGGNAFVGLSPAQAVVTPAQMAPQQLASQSVHTNGQAIADLVAYRDFKNNYSELFAENSAGAVNLASAQAINTEVNHAISYQDDEPGVEVWHVQANGGLGNCHDYAVTKLAKMLAAGTPRSALRLTVASVNETGEWHLMLAVDVPGQGTMFMDSNRENIMTADQARDLYTLWFMENPASQHLEVVG
jgi:predicted transglutaminase-like cysteine proteinase